MVAQKKSLVTTLRVGIGVTGGGRMLGGTNRKKERRATRSGKEKKDGKEEATKVNGQVEMRGQNRSSSCD